jgi:hypothetical protein
MEWHHPHDAFFVDIQNARVTGNEGFHPDVKRRPERLGNVYSCKREGKATVRSLDVGDAKNMECLLRKATGTEWNHPKRETM